MTNFNSNFIPNYSDRTSKLRELVTDTAKWNWTDDHEHSFQILKDSLSSSCLIHYFDPKLETELICDASPIGVAATVVQKDTGGNRKVVAHGSRALTKTEQKYGQIEREALSILFGCLKFQIYLLGEKFTILTDHLPLIPCFNNPKTQQPYRIERMRMKLQRFDYDVKHIPGKSNISDYMSRHLNTSSYEPTKQEREIEAHVHFIIQKSLDCVSIEEMQYDTARDTTLSKIRELLRKEEIINKNDVTFSTFHYVTGHEGHQGIVKTKQLLRSKYWWTAMDRQIENIVVNCRLPSIGFKTREGTPKNDGIAERTLGKCCYRLSWTFEFRRTFISCNTADIR